MHDTIWFCVALEKHDLCEVYGILKYIGYIDLLKGCQNGFNVPNYTTSYTLWGLVVQVMGVVERLLQSFFCKLLLLQHNFLQHEPEQFLKRV